MLLAVTLPRGGRWVERMAGGVGRPWGTTSTVPHRFVLARLAAACVARAVRPNSPLLSAAAVAMDYLMEPAGLYWQSRWTADRLSCDARARLCCGAGGRAGLSCGGRRTVLIVSLDTHRTVLRCPRRTVLRRRRQGWMAATMIARLAGGGVGTYVRWIPIIWDRSWGIRYICMWDTDFWIWDLIWAWTGRFNLIEFGGGGCTGANL
jgi:hypothetical protein